MQRRVIAFWVSLAAACALGPACGGNESAEQRVMRQARRLVADLCACTDAACAERVRAATTEVRRAQEPLSREQLRALRDELLPLERQWRDCHERLHPRRYTADGAPMVEAPLVPLGAP